MAANPFKGVFTALVTPFRDGQFDENAFARIVERQIAAGVHGLVPVGTTGETSTLSHKEHRRVVSVCVEVAAGRRPVIAGAGSNSTEEAAEFVRHAAEAGADAALVVTPYYNRPSQEGLYLHYATLAARAELPIFVYNVPGRTGVDISEDTLARLAELPNIAGIKDATGDLGRASQQRRRLGPDWVLLSGDDPSALGYMAHGGHGCISVTSNVAPAACAAMFEASIRGDWRAALDLQDRLIRLHKALFLDASPSPAKYALSRLGLCAEESRLPIAPCAERHRAEIDAAMEESGAAP
ncbi:MAG TPA: 4-hydroxy-tetrahydrodipicolinate synthase [Caulobacteraceae bacterium]|jgi:4-hydroxy-tetrahydrodipicolinate synthase|nr:4-hydroxy-tetrahydrodipicolinate synthase [Caulobacteraceae bacterium]